MPKHSFTQKDTTSHPIPFFKEIEVAYSGPDLSEGPLPALIYFSLSAKESLELNPYNQIVSALVDKPIRLFSFTLPAHGHGQINEEAMEHWAEGLKNSPNYFEDYFSQVSHAIYDLIEKEIIQSDAIATGGLSRGAFVALHLAARLNEISTVLGLAPLVDLSYLPEFKEIDIPSELNISNQVESLAKKAIRFYIGNRDVRVGTECCFELVKEIANYAYNKGVRSPFVELVVSPSTGRNGHGTLPNVFYNGAEWISERVGIENDFVMRWKK